jgi:hypothetical protein
LAGIDVDIASNKLLRDKMQPSCLVLIDEWDELLMSKLDPALHDCVDGFNEWKASLPGGVVTHEAIHKLFNDEDQMKIWLKRRVVFFQAADPEWGKEEIIEEKILGPEVPGKIGMACYQAGN